MPQKRSCDEMQHNPLLRKKGLLNAALGCIYMQSQDDMHLTLGRKSYIHEGYEHVLTEEERHGECVLGYMAQGRVKSPPPPDALEWMSPKQFLRDDHIAACVRTYWIYAHMFLKPRGEPEAYDEPDFAHALRLVDRAAETMCRISIKIGQAALDLAEELGIKERVVRADEEAFERLEFPAEKKEETFVPRLPWEFSEMLRRRAKYSVPDIDKDEKRLEFEKTVIEVFGYHVCTAEDNWVDCSDVMLSVTGLRKRYGQMTPAERLSSGSVHLRLIMERLRSDDTVEAAIMESLMAARALEKAARMLVGAGQKYNA